MNFTNGLIDGIFLGGVLASFFGALVSIRLAAILQQGGYSAGRFFKWYFAKGNIQRKRLSLLSLSLVLLLALFNVCFSFLDYRWANLIAVVPFVGMFALYLWAEKKYALKVPAKITPRLKRLNVAHVLVLVIVWAGIGFGLAGASFAVNASWFFSLRFVPFALLPLLLPFTLVCSNFIMALYEIPHNKRFVRRAGKALAESKCVKVGITGSYGKTSVKHFAAQMLGVKFKVISTPASYNTPMGIARTVKEQGLDCDIFLAEMGARHTGDIAELCDLVSPAYGVVTGVCEQHIETFGSLEAIKKEKGVLSERAETVVLGTTVVDFPAKQALREGIDFSVQELVCTAEGFSFRLCIKGQDVPIKTRLLGRSAAEDVALAAALCYTLGMTPAEIAFAADSLEPVPHRLEKIEANGLVILDDSYNSNIEGAKNAIETLRLFAGRKVVVTPGLVELGQLEESLNEVLGAQLTGLDVILVGETLVLPVRRGYLAAGGEESRLKIVPTLQKAQEILSKELKDGDCVLFLNDLPDIYR